MRRRAKGWIHTRRKETQAAGRYKYNTHVEKAKEVQYEGKEELKCKQRKQHSMGVRRNKTKSVERHGK